MLSAAAASLIETFTPEQLLERSAELLAEAKRLTFEAIAAGEESAAAWDRLAEAMQTDQPAEDLRRRAEERKARARFLDEMATQAITEQLPFQEAVEWLAAFAQQERK